MGGGNATRALEQMPRPDACAAAGCARGGLNHYSGRAHGSEHAADEHAAPQALNDQGRNLSMGTCACSSGVHRVLVVMWARLRHGIISRRQVRVVGTWQAQTVRTKLV